METTGQEPATAEIEAEVEAPKVDSGGGETESAESAPAVAEPDKPEPRDKVQERFDKLTREKYEGLSRAERAEYRAQMLEQRLADLEAQAKTQTVAPSDAYPTLESVGYDESKHAIAVSAWSAKQAREAAKAELEATREAQRRQELETTWERKQAEYIKSKPDYTEKVLKDPRYGGPVVTPEMAEVIRASDIGPEVAYYLAENVERSAEIARLPAHLQAREIGRIEARLEAAKAPPPPPVSKAPAPVAKIDAAESNVPVPPDSPDSDKIGSAEEWAKRRNKQMLKRYGRI